MTKLELSNQINHIAKTIIRTIHVDEKLNLNIGDIYDNRGNAESWQDEYADSNFSVERPDMYEYTFICRGEIQVFKVDYEDEEICETLNCEGCESESEVLINPNAKFRIIDVATDDDYKEMGYYEITLELIKE